ncbi:MAG: tRNA (guanosine(37)-N1)-methyltransferase TrmD [Anaerolinea sp.]|nr:tRNA (guanosine(37)-N1)-methyltransferase TrmD [Anaerolinea sp.]MCC6972912.1 tRNA (guanosine(37)-N1)-methyltransferase TrmD [Anaerolineae bacterium]CAG1010681.1 tRNA (guanine-N(1)-)-methyltransferase [Anaerolineae bacterium]
MRIDVLTLFPGMFEGPLTESILKRAQENGLIEVRLHNIRDYALDKHRVTDEPPYGGGGGMVMKVEPLVSAVEDVLEGASDVPVILTTPQGRVFTQEMARRLAEHPRLVILCGRYEGVDERVRQLVVTEEISIGDFVLTGGELPAMVMIDAIVRHLPGVLGDPNAAAQDSHATGLLEHAHYTRPPEFRGMSVPALLQSGDHGAVARFRRQDSIRRTWERRPDLLLEATLSETEQYGLAALALEWLNKR